MKWLIFLAVFCPAAVFSDATSKPPALPIKKLVIGQQSLRVEVATKEEDRSRGLMYRTELKEGTGMLFVFEKAQTLSFWMKNTFIPLSIGYFDARKRLVDVQDMEPVKSEMQSDLPSYTSRTPAKYALEVPKGWFSRNKIQLGAVFRLE